MKYLRTAGCACERCKSLCKRRPGWFLPEEIRPVAEFLGLTTRQLYEKYLVIDYWARSDEDGGEILLLCPGSLEEHGKKASFAFAFASRCIFLTDGELCAIHGVKPYECAVVGCGSVADAKAHEYVARQWEGRDDFIHELTGERVAR